MILYEELGNELPRLIETFREEPPVIKDILKLNKNIFCNCDETLKRFWSRYKSKSRSASHVPSQDYVDMLLELVQIAELQTASTAVDLIQALLSLEEGRQYFWKVLFLMFKTPTQSR